MTFHAKLLQAILGVVVVTTAASLFVAQSQNSASYQAVVDELFSNQTTAFQREQEARLEAAASEAERLAGSVRLFAALEENDPEVYKIAGDELRIGEFTFFRLLNARGKLIAPPADGRAGALDTDAVRGSLIPETLTTDAPATPATDGQAGVQLGFIEVSRGRDKSPAVYRVLSSPIVNFDTHVGTLILGQRIGRLAKERPRAAAGKGETPEEGVHSGLWVDGRLVGDDIPERLRAPLAAALGTEPLSEHNDARLDADGGTYRYHRVRLNEGSSYPPAYLVSVFSLGEFQSQQRLLAVRITLTGLVALVVAGLLAFALSGQLARPIASLVAATRQIRKGNYELRLAPSSTTEMNLLAESFNDMAVGLAARDRYHSVLQQVTDAQVAEELIAGRVKLGGELREVTVMFCDVRDYTSVIVGRRPEDVIEILNQHLGALTRIVQAHQGVVNQFAGDSIMALFGAPKSYGDDAERAVRAACAMMIERERMNVDAAVPLKVGIGIASGQMVAGCIGAESRIDYTVVGERVNLAARLCSSAAPGQIIVDDETRRRIGSTFAAARALPLSLKGFSDSVTAYDVTPLKASAG